MLVGSPDPNPRRCEPDAHGRRDPRRFAPGLGLLHLASENGPFHGADRIASVDVLERLGVGGAQIVDLDAAGLAEPLVVEVAGLDHHGARRSVSTHRL